MRKQYRVSLMVNCGKNMFDGLEFMNKCISVGLVDEDNISLCNPNPIKVDGVTILDHYTVHINTTSDSKKKLIKYFKLKKDTCIDGSPMRDGYVL